MNRWIPRGPRSAVALALALAAAAPAEVLHLRDGGRVEGPLREIREGEFVFDDGRTVKVEEVAAVDLEAPAASAASPARPGLPAGSEPEPEATREPEVETWAKQADALEARHPGYPGLILLDESRWTYAPGGARTLREKKRIKVQKDSAIGYGAFQVGFDPSRQRVHLLGCRTVLPDGRVLPLDPGKVRIQDQRSSASQLTNRKVMVWRLDGVEVGSFIEHEYELEEFAPFEPDFFFPREAFGSRLPVGRKVFEVRMPPGKTLHTAVRGATPDELGQEVESSEGGGTVFRWTVEGRDPWIPEPGMPGVGDLVPRVFASTLPGWEPFFTWERGNLERNITPTPAVEARTRALVEGLDSAADKVAALYRFLQREIRYVSVKSGIGSGWSGHPAGETLENGYGDCVDKSVLFCSMLRTLGIDAAPLTLMTNDVHDMGTELPGFDANHCITRVTLPAEGAEPARDLVLDSTSTNFRFPYFRADDHGQPATDALKGKILRVPVPPPEDNRVERVLAMEISPAGDLRATETWAATGPSEAAERGFWKARKPRDYPEIFRDYYAGQAPGARVTSHEVGDVDDLTRGMTYSAGFEADGYAVRAGPLMIVKLPFLEVRFAEGAPETRRYPIDYRTTRETVIRWEVRLPPGWRVRAGPGDVDLRTPYASVRITSRTREDGVHVIERVHRIEEPLVPVDAYPAYRRFLKEFEARGKDQLFLEEVPE